MIPWRELSILKAIVLVTVLALIGACLTYDPQPPAPVPAPVTAPVTVPAPVPEPQVAPTPVPAVKAPLPAPSLKKVVKAKPKLAKRPKHKLDCSAVPNAAYTHEHDTVISVAKMRGVTGAKLAMLEACLAAKINNG